MVRPSKKDQPNQNIFQDPQDILMNAPVGVFTTTPDGRYLSVNNALARMQGYDSPRELIDSIADIAKQVYVNPADREELKRLLEKHGEVINFECLLRHRNGGHLWVSENISVIKDKDGNIIAYQGFNQDVTARKRAELKERESEERFRLMFMNAPMPYQSLDEQGNFLDVNQTFLNVLGYSREELIGKNFSDILHPDWREHFKENFPKFKAVGEILGVEFEMVKKDGSTIRVYFNGKIQRDDQNRFVRTHCIFQDVTQRKRAEDKLRITNNQLQRVNAEKDKLLSIIAHDLKSPISGIYSTSQILDEEVESLALEEISFISAEMHKSSKNALELLNDLMQWARMSQGGMDFSPEECFLGDLVNLSLHVAQDIAGKKEITIKPDIPEGLTVLVDQPMINTVIRNIIFNAVKFTNRGGNIFITASNAGSDVEVCVQDDGIGMSDVILSSIFTVEKSQRPLGTDGERGTGLGLILCKEFVEKHGGKIWVESEPGKGTKVFFTLPAGS